MNRKLLFTFLIGALLVLLYNFEIHTRNFFLTMSDSIKKSYLHIYDDIRLWWEALEDAKQKIEQLKKINRQLYSYKLAFKDLQARVAAIKKECNITIKANLPVRYVEVISYVRPGDFSAVWLDTHLKPEKVYGLIKNGSVAGIGIDEDGRALGLLTSNPKCSFGVAIGKQKVDGIAMGIGRDDRMVVKFIPRYKKITIGQKVVTSGLDGIFIPGLSVGEVIGVKAQGSYQIATIKLASPLKNPRFLWLMEL